MVLVRSLRLMLLLGLAALLVTIAISLSANARLGTSRGLSAASAAAVSPARVARRALDVEILRTRRGTPTLRLQARESRTLARGSLDLADVTFRVFGPQGRETLVHAPRATSLSQGEGGSGTPPATGAAPAQRAAAAGPEAIGSWLLDGGVAIEAGALRLQTPALAYLEAEGQARTSAQVRFARGAASGSATGMVYDVASQSVSLLHDVSAAMAMGATGRVRVEADRAVYDLSHETIRMEAYRAITRRGELLTGARLTAFFRDTGGIERLEGEGGFLLESTHAVRDNGSESLLSKLLAQEGRRTMRGERIAVVLGPRGEPMSIEVSGKAHLTAGDATREGTPSSIAAQTLSFDLINGILRHARAAGHVDLKGAPAAGESAGFHMITDFLEAEFDPSLGAIQRLEGRGETRLSDRGMESEGNRTSLDPNADIVTLSGDEDRPASATWLGRKIQARRIEADRRQKTLSARQGVRASYVPPPEGAGGRALPFFRGGETIYAMAGSVTFADQGREAHYRDRVRLWQGENRLEAAEVDLHETRGTLEAGGDVVSTFRQPPPQARGGSATPWDGIVTVAASAMRYERDADRIVYRGRVLVTQGPLHVTADSVVVTLEPGGGAARLMEASGGVEVRDLGRRGKGDHLVVDLREDTLKLSGAGREAIVQDEENQQVVRGKSLTMHRSSDRILVESELGGRTWITLKPRQEGAPGGGSDPDN